MAAAAGLVSTLLMHVCINHEAITKRSDMGGEQSIIQHKHHLTVQTVTMLLVHCIQRFFSSYRKKSFYILRLKSRSPKFKGKCFVSVIGKFKFSVPSGDTGLLSPYLTQFLCLGYSIVKCLCKKRRAFLMQRFVISWPFAAELLKKAGLQEQFPNVGLAKPT
jgi:hypothetical protein